VSLGHVKFWGIKPEIRVLGLDDGSFKPRVRGKALVIGVVLRSGRMLEGVMSTSVEIDGTDATGKVIEMVNRSRHKPQLRVIMSEGITLAGFNVLDLGEIFRQTGLPMIVVTRKKPNMLEVKKALKHLPCWRERWRMMKAAGKVYPVSFRGRKIYMQLAGIRREDAEKILTITTTHGVMPEPLRVAHLIATGMTRGESVGRV